MNAQIILHPTMLPKLIGTGGIGISCFIWEQYIFYWFPYLSLVWKQYEYVYLLRIS